MDRAVETAVIAGSRGAVDFSIIGLFLNADLIVKAVIIMLILTSIWSWAIIIEKLLRLRRLQTRANEFEDMVRAFWKRADELFSYPNQKGSETGCGQVLVLLGRGLRKWLHAS